jgi:hypothetical protein
MKPRFFAVLVACTLLAACSGAPSDSRMADQIAGQFNDEFGTDFVRVDHLSESEGHMDGKTRYVADVAYELRFTKSLAEVRDAAGPVQAMELAVLYGDFSKGDTKQMRNRVVFEKTDKGWVLTDSRRDE